MYRRAQYATVGPLSAGFGARRRDQIPTDLLSRLSCNLFVVLGGCCSGSMKIMNFGLKLVKPWASETSSTRLSLPAGVYRAGSTMRSVGYPF